LSGNEQNEEQIEETPATPESVEETSVEAEAPGKEPEAAAEETPAEEPAAEEPVAEEPAAEEPAAEEPTAEEPAAETEEAPEAEAEAASSDADAEGEAPAVQPEPKKKRKRLPRRLRPQKTRRRVASTGERKPIVRQPKPEHERGRRQERRGIVVSSAMDKTIVVKVDLISSHQRYKKVIRRSVKFHAHDEQNTAKVGDVVRIVETRPLSATKRWRLAEIVEVAQ
jgi:small subunit ribosomal protein S17